MRRALGGRLVGVDGPPPNAGLVGAAGWPKVPVAVLVAGPLLPEAVDCPPPLAKGDWPGPVGTEGLPKAVVPFAAEAAPKGVELPNVEVGCEGAWLPKAEGVVPAPPPLLPKGEGFPNVDCGCEGCPNADCGCGRLPESRGIRWCLLRSEGAGTSEGRSIGG